MSCQFINGYCGCCSKLVETTDVKLKSKTIILTIPEVELTNGLLQCILISQAIPDISDLDYVPNVAIEVENVGTYTIIQTISQGLCGTPNNLYADQLARCYCNNTLQFRSKQMVNVRYGTDTMCFNYVGAKPVLKPTDGLDTLYVREVQAEPHDIITDEE